MIELISQRICQYIPWPSVSWLLTLLAFFVVIAVLSWFANKIAKFVLVKMSHNLISAINPKWGDVFQKHQPIRTLSHIVPALVFYAFSNGLQTNDMATIVQIGEVMELMCFVYIVLTIAICLYSLLNTIYDIYNQYPISIRLPIKTYMQVLKFVLVGCAGIIVVSIILDTSPLAFFTGLGAATAVIMLVFKDSILGLVASVQLSLSDIVRIGDWITAPSYNVDGDVIEVSLSTVKVRNFDKTISTIPTYALLSTGLQNWRGMKESGGRRIKRALHIDMDYIHFYTLKDLETLKKAAPQISDYLDTEITKMKEKGEQEAISNSKVYREYITSYLRNHPGIHQEGFTFLIRHLEPTDKGLPIQLYVFTRDTNWVNHENVQSDIFDHLIAAAPIFDLKIFQDSVGKVLQVKVTN